jgi:serine/threonine protein kinase
MKLTGPRSTRGEQADMPIRFHTKLGSGAFGDVWSAVDSLDREIAVKIVRASGALSSTALDHAMALARANHPNVVSVYTVEKAPDPETGIEVDCILMELIRGEKLAERIRGPALAVDEVRTIGLGIIDGVEHIHRQGLAHGDLHSENVMVDGIHAKLIDILYLNTLAALTTQSKNERLRRDLISLRFILQDVLFYSVLDPGVVTDFNNLLHTSADLDSIRAAFTAVTNPDSSTDTQQLLEHVYRRATDEGFVAGDEYASALMDETPRAVVFPLLSRLIEERGFDIKHEAYVRALWTALDDAEIAQIIALLNQRLDEDVPNGKWFPNLRLVARLRKEASSISRRAFQIGEPCCERHSFRKA